MNADTSLSPRGQIECKSEPYRNTVFLSGTLQKNSISLGVRDTQVLATTTTTYVTPGLRTKALIWV